MARNRLGLRHGIAGVGAFVASLAIAPPPGYAAENSAPHRGPISTGQYQPAPRAAWCADHNLAALTMSQRLEGRNLVRLRHAQAELAPGFEAGNAKTGLHLMAAYQEELEKARPDPATAASYLALASAVPITMVRVRQVNAFLCVSITRAKAEAIRADAEKQREQLNR